MNTIIVGDSIARNLALQSFGPEYTVWAYKKLPKITDIYTQNTHTHITQYYSHIDLAIVIVGGNDIDNENTKTEIILQAFIDFMAELNSHNIRVYLVPITHREKFRTNISEEYFGTTADFINNKLDSALTDTFTYDPIIRNIPPIMLGDRVHPDSISMDQITTCITEHIQNDIHNIPLNKHDTYIKPDTRKSPLIQITPRFRGPLLPTPSRPRGPLLPTPYITHIHMQQPQKQDKPAIEHTHLADRHTPDISQADEQHTQHSPTQIDPLLFRARVAKLKKKEKTH